MAGTSPGMTNKKKRARLDRARFAVYAIIQRRAYSAEYLNSGIAFISSLVALYTA
jgi:hypothetical protein